MGRDLTSLHVTDRLPPTCLIRSREEGIRKCGGNNNIIIIIIDKNIKETYSTILSITRIYEIDISIKT